MSEVAETQQNGLPILALDGPRAGALADLGAVNQDIKFVMQCSQRLIVLTEAEEPDEVLVQALFTAALITYARCFNSGKRSSLHENDLSKLGLPGDDILGFHRQVLDMRSKHVAHSINPFEMISAGAIMSAPDVSPAQVEGVAVFTVRHVAFDKDGVRHLREVCARLLDQVIAPRSERLRALAVEEARALPIADLVQRRSLRAQPPGPEFAGLKRR